MQSIRCYQSSLESINQQETVHPTVNPDLLQSESVGSEEHEGEGTDREKDMEAAMKTNIGEEEEVRGTSELGGETTWLNHTIKLLNKAQLNREDNMSWAACHAECIGQAELS